MRFSQALIPLAVAALVRSPQAAEPVAPGPPDVASFARHPRFVGAKISPNGTYLALIDGDRGVNTLTFLHIATRKVTYRLFSDGESMPGDFRWVSDDRVVVELVDLDPSVMARPVWRGEIYAVDAMGKAGRMIFGYRAGEMQTGSHIKKSESTRAWGEVIGILPDDPRHVTVAAQAWNESGDAPSRVYKVDVYSGVQQLLLNASPTPRSQFLTDDDGEPRIARGWDADGTTTRYFSRDPGGVWRELATLKGIARTHSPMAFVPKERTLYFADAAEDGFGLWALDLATGTKKLVVRTGIAPPHTLVTDPTTHRVVAVESDPDLPRYDYADPQHPLARALRGLAETFQGEHVRFLSVTRDGKKAVVAVYSDRSPARFLLMDVEKMTAEEIGSSQPWIDPERMGETTAFHINASDGFRLHGYVTLPPAPVLGSPPPLVVVPHGGPHFLRDEWRFDPRVQLLATRGFAVLQVNYRGSGGYGDAYQEAGYRRWGDRVVEDVVDGTRFAIRKGFGDGRRVCIFGGSFGAFAALQAAILAPDLFRCAVGFAGIYDLTRMTSSDFAEARLGRAYLRTVLGDSEVERKRMSPVHNADKVKARVLLVHGEKDRRAPIEHAELLRKALEKSGNAPEWLVEPNEGHGFYDVAARERMYARVLAFLRENTVAPPAPPPPAPAAATAPPAPAPAAPAAVPAAAK